MNGKWTLTRTSGVITSSTNVHEQVLMGGLNAPKHAKLGAYIHGSHIEAARREQEKGQDGWKSPACLVAQACRG